MYNVLIDGYMNEWIYECLYVLTHLNSLCHFLFLFSKKKKSQSKQQVGSTSVTINSKMKEFNP
jgi:hypothetical protein